jgi:membrane protease YdiL (CAAX protease family)
VSRAAATRPTNRMSSAAVSPLPSEGYFRRSESPLHSLAFVLPLMILFEIATSFHPSSPIAFRLLQLFFQQLGATGRFIPALSLVGILLSWHIARKDSWRLRIDTLWGMGLESWMLCLPLVTLGIAFARWNIHVPLYGKADALRDETILSVGAGVYEELVFRLMLMTVIMLVTADVLRLPKLSSNLLMVGSSAILFSLYHYLGTETFQWRSFAFRTVAGIYFSILFLTRGFGITAGCHVAYDIMIVALQAWASR